MLEYLKEECGGCGEETLIYHQYLGDVRCETCGRWQDEEDGE